ncbi:hypothetical protein KKE60_07960 [Patescibacteria group bacterium]|nr:hypothetical protein [Patescibacteria group bacterium]
MAIGLPFSIDNLIPFVTEGSSGRGTMEVLRAVGYAFSDAPFWDMWRTAASYEKGRWAASQLPGDQLVPSANITVTDREPPGEYRYQMTYRAHAPVSGEYTTQYHAVRFDAPMTPDQAAAQAYEEIEEAPEGRYPWEVEQMTLKGVWLGKAA